ncbi:MAG: class I tRNA ligase family protein [Sphingobacteriaceae bacterium]|nr:class I tRNA ligase family protein [Sphingobacteriaceae bacterium]
MSEYSFEQAESFWGKVWQEQEIYKTKAAGLNLPKYYVLDMFPYPSGAGLHVGHPLGYIASDIVARHKRMQGFNVLHPMGFDAFGLPAEQYAIQTGQHPALTTETNIKRYKEQLNKIGFSFDWSREVQTCDPAYYRWTQWIFIQLFESWYNTQTNQAEPISALIAQFEKQGTLDLKAHCDENSPAFTAADWQSFDEKQQSELLMHYRLAFLAEARVNWCPALGTVLANDEVKDGLSERGGYPVEIRMMKQWMMRISAYSQRLLDGLGEIDWSDAIKEQQKNWIGRSEGASIHFQLADHTEQIEVFTTRPDTIFGVSFMVLAPEHELVKQITTPAQKAEVDAYILKTKNRSERERMADVKSVSGAFTGAYVLHPFTQQPIPVWIADYVLAGYGTGAVMAVPGGDERDWRFARHFGLPIIDVIEGSDIEQAANPSKDARMINSDFLNGMVAKEAISVAIQALEKLGCGKGKIQFRLRDAIFSRQRYWGEPVPIYFENGIPKAVPFEHINQITLPAVDKYLPTEDGEPPLARAENWTYQGHPIETTTMPGWAGSSWYFLRYMDPQNPTAFADRAATDYWNQVDLYMGGSEHATGHLLYARFWTQFLYDRQLIGFKEPFKKLVNQGMIQGQSKFAYFVWSDKNYLVPPNAIWKSGNVIGVEVQKAFKHFPTIFTEQENGKHYITHQNLENLNNSKDEQYNQFKSFHIAKKSEIEEFILNAEELEFFGDKVEVVMEVEKMSKSKWNVVNPDDIIAQYGADTLRLYEMFLGPLEDSKPWDTKGIEGVYRFLQKLWRLFHENGELALSQDAASEAELKIIHRTIKKITDDIERFSFNTCVSAFMICVNDLQALKCRKAEVLHPLVRLLAPFAPFITESLWQALGQQGSVHTAAFPSYEAKYLVDDTFDYPIQENGKMRFNLTMPLKASKEDLEALVLAHDKVLQLQAGRVLKKIIVVPGRIVNLVF